MLDLQNGLTYMMLIGVGMTLFLIIFKMIINTKRGVFKQYTKTYIIFGIAAITMAFAAISNNSSYKQRKIDEAKQAKQVQAEYAPNSKTLTEKSISKTFTYDYDLKGYDSDQANVNKQVNRYLNSISNLDDYQLKTMTHQAKHSFFGSEQPYSQTVQLTRKQY